ncbi:MAG: nitroreductase family protein [Pirellulaceae bacterium]|nr:nitroreductase family protein [Pirellulaceae bacterium]
MSGMQSQAELVEKSLSAMDAIYGRRSVRDYAPERIDHATIHALLAAAVQAPTAMHEEPWAFAVVQDKQMLQSLSDTAKELLASGTDAIHSVKARLALDRFTQTEFNVFYNAGTLIVICGKPIGPFVAADCWLAAENLMLAATSKGLGSCVIGLAVPALNTPEWKLKLNIPQEINVFAPIIVGIPNSEAPSVPRKPPQILCWER